MSSHVLKTLGVKAIMVHRTQMREFQVERLFVNSVKSTTKFFLAATLLPPQI